MEFVKIRTLHQLFDLNWTGLRNIRLDYEILIVSSQVKFSQNRLL